MVVQGLAHCLGFVAHRQNAFKERILGWTTVISMVKVAINGFGRIGRMVFRAGYYDPEIEFVAINDITSPETLAYLLKRDSVHGSFPGRVGFDENAILVDGNRIPVYAERDPAQLPWKDHRVDVAIESTGFFTSRELAAKHLDAGARRVLLSAPGKGIDLTIVKGVNEHRFDPAQHTVVSNASCTTNNVAPVVKVLHDNFGVEKCFFVTIHSYTGDQRLVDAPHKDMRRGRHAAMNIVPTTSGAALSVVEAIPELSGRIDGHAVRVPTPDGSLTDLNVVLSREVSVEEVSAIFESVANYHLKGILEFSREALVSSDVIGNPHSTIVDAALTRVSGNLLSVFAWYDNEFGYSNRMIDIVKLIAI